MRMEKLTDSCGLFHTQISKSFDLDLGHGKSMGSTENGCMDDNTDAYEVSIDYAIG